MRDNLHTYLFHSWLQDMVVSFLSTDMRVLCQWQDYRQDDDTGSQSALIITSEINCFIFLTSICSGYPPLLAQRLSLLTQDKIQSYALMRIHPERSV